MTEPQFEILIVDDDENLASNLQDILQEEGYGTAIVQDGQTALNLCRKKAFDLAIIDIRLPDMLGIELLEPLKKMHPDMVMIMVTGYATLETAVRALNEGVSAYITKPLNIEEVLIRVREVLEKQHLIKENGRLYKEAQRELAERKRAEEGLRESEERYRTLFESAAQGILIIDSETLGFRYANPAISRMLGYSAEELKEIGVSDIYPKTLSVHAFSEIEAQARGEKALARNIPYLRKDGTIIYADINTAKAVIDKRECSIAFFSDVTERKLREQQRKQSTEQLLNAMQETIQALALTTEMRDPYTAGHQQRVTELACAIAGEIHLSKKHTEGLRMAAIVHDIGKIYVPAEILSKPGRLTETEFGMIKVHPRAGYDILKHIEFPWPIAQIVLQHHERMDGSGYPEGLSEEKILLETRILVVADVVEAIASHRPYRPALGIDKALQEISQNRGILYDSEVVGACFKLHTEKEFMFWEDSQAQGQAVGSR